MKISANGSLKKSRPPEMQNRWKISLSWVVSGTVRTKVAPCPDPFSGNHGKHSKRWVFGASEAQLPGSHKAFTKGNFSKRRTFVAFCREGKNDRRFLKKVERGDGMDQEKSNVDS